MDEYLLQDQYAEMMASIDPMSASYGFVREEWEEGLAKIESSLEMDYTWIGAGTEGEDIFYQVLDSTFDVLDDVGKDSTYEIKIGKRELEILGERFEQYFDRGYDKPELIGYLRAEHPNTAKSHFRSQENLPSDQPFISRFGTWNNAVWRAGLPAQEQVDSEQLEHQLRKKTHEMNESRDLLIETASARDLDEDPDTHNEKNFQDIFGSIENAYREGHLGTVREMEKQQEQWRQLIYSPHSKLIELRTEDTGHKLE